MIDKAKLAELCGFDVQIKEASDFLLPPYRYLVIVRHASDHFRKVLITPVAEYDSGIESIYDAVLDQVPEMIEFVGLAMQLGGTPCHDEPYIETIRIAKEASIMAQRFDDAAYLRDIERKLQRGDY